MPRNLRVSTTSTNQFILLFHEAMPRNLRGSTTSTSNRGYCLAEQFIWLSTSTKAYMNYHIEYMACIKGYIISLHKIEHNAPSGSVQWTLMSYATVLWWTFMGWSTPSNFPRNVFCTVFPHYLYPCIIVLWSKPSYVGRLPSLGTIYFCFTLPDFSKIHTDVTFGHIGHLKS